jgi:beta-glucanase (GH16 family)
MDVKHIIVFTLVWINFKIEAVMKRIYFLFLILMFAALHQEVTSQEYQLVWEDNFDGDAINKDVWNVENQVGIWNTGSNQELQHYRTENVTVGPDGLGNNALILTAKREVYNGYQFTSGRVNTRNKVTAKYGKIEARIKMPVLADGLWPAFWSLGTQNGWPSSGEIDIMEAGHSYGIQNNLQERNMNGALHWENDGNYAGYGPQVQAPVGTSLYDYNRFTLEWTPTNIKMYLNDAVTPYFSMNISGVDAEEFRDWTHYFIFNLAVGGSFPGITNPDNITSPLPAEMYIDYLRIYQKEGEGELTVADPVVPSTGDYYGVFTERASITNKFLIDDVTGHIYLWNNLAPMVGQTPYEGTDLLAFKSSGAGWCGFGIFSNNPLDFSHYESGYLNFAIKIPSGSTSNFGVRIEGAENTKGEVVFAPGADPFGVVRNGNWHFISVPMTQLTAQGLNLTACGNILAVVSETPTSGFIIDDVFLSVDLPSSVLQPKSDKTELTVYPNPANNQFQVVLNSQTEKVVVMNLTGSVVFKMEGLAGSNAIEISCSDWAKGIYVVSTVQTDGSISVAKVSVK